MSMLEYTAGGRRPLPPRVSSPPPRRPRAMPAAVTPARARPRKPGKRPVSPFYLGDEEDARAREAAAVRHAEELEAAMDQVGQIFGERKAAVRGEDDSGVICGSGDDAPREAGGEECAEGRWERERVHVREAEAKRSATDGAGFEHGEQEQQKLGRVTGRKRMLSGRKRKPSEDLSSEDSDTDDFVVAKRVRVTVVPSRRRSTQSSAKKAGRSSGPGARPSQQTPSPMDLAEAPESNLGSDGSLAARPRPIELEKSASERDLPAKTKRTPVKFQMPPRKPFSSRVGSADRTPSPEKKGTAMKRNMSFPTPPALSPGCGDASALSSEPDDLLLSHDFSSLKARRPNSKDNRSKAKSLFPDEEDEVLQDSDRERSGLSSDDDVALLRQVTPVGRTSSRGRPGRRQAKESAANARGSEGGEPGLADAPRSSARRRLRRVASDSEEDNESFAVEPGKAPERGSQKKSPDAAIVISLDSGSDSGGESVKFPRPTPGRRILPRAALEPNSAGRRRAQRIPSTSDSDDSVLKLSTVQPKPTPGRRRLDKSALTSEPFRPRRRAQRLHFDSDSDESPGYSDSNVDEDDDLPILRAKAPSSKNAVTRNKAKRPSTRTKSPGRRADERLAIDEADLASPIVVLRRTPKAHAVSASQDGQPVDSTRRDNWMNEREINEFSDSSEQERPSSHMPRSAPEDASKSEPVSRSQAESRRRRKLAEPLQDLLTQEKPSPSGGDREVPHPRRTISPGTLAEVDLDRGGDWDDDNIIEVVEEGRGHRRGADSLAKKQARSTNRSSRNGAAKSSAKPADALIFDDGHESESMDQLLKLEAAANEADFDDTAEGGLPEPDILYEDPKIANVKTPGVACAGTSARPAPFDVRSLCDSGETVAEMFQRLGEDTVMDAVFQAQEEGRRVVGGEDIGLDPAAMGSQESPNFLQSSNFGKTTEVLYSKSRYTHEMARASLTGSKERVKQKYENKFRSKKGRSTWKKKRSFGGNKKDR